MKTLTTVLYALLLTLTLAKNIHHHRPLPTEPYAPLGDQYSNRPIKEQQRINAESSYLSNLNHNPIIPEQKEEQSDDKRQAMWTFRICLYVSVFFMAFALKKCLQATPKRIPNQSVVREQLMNVNPYITADRPIAGFIQQMYEEERPTPLQPYFMQNETAVSQMQPMRQSRKMRQIPQRRQTHRTEQRHCEVRQINAQPSAVEERIQYHMNQLQELNAKMRQIQKINAKKEEIDYPNLPC